MNRADIVTAEDPRSQGDDVVAYSPAAEFNDNGLPETDDEAEAQGPTENWEFWNKQIAAAMVDERRARQEALEAEQLYFGPDNDPGGSSTDQPSNRITDKQALIHANIDVLRPLVYSDTPTPVVRRRYRGDGRADATALMAAEAGQRIAQYLIDTSDFDHAMEGVRDDWLIPGRGAARAIYKATFETMTEMVNGTPVQVEKKTDEEVCVRHIPYRRFLMAPCDSWFTMPWIAFEVPMTRSAIKKRFGAKIADAMSYNQAGLIDSDRAPGDDDRAGTRGGLLSDGESDLPAASPFDTAMVWEIWNKEGREDIWWSNAYKEDVLDKVEDPLGLEKFWPMPMPLLATTKAGSLRPRPDVKYYEQRAREIDMASEKLKSILQTISVSGLFPGAMQDEIKKILNGRNQMVAVADWIGLMEKGGTREIIQWLPLEAMVAAINALLSLREMARQAMFEASGVSDIMRAQGDPTETATAQQIKGRYAGLRLSERQKRMAIYARDMIRIMLEIAVEHFDTSTLAEICGLDLPLTEAERMQMEVTNDAIRKQFEMKMAAWQQAKQAIDAGALALPPGVQIPPPPEEPELEPVPSTSWELVHAQLRDDFRRKITVTIETQSTVLADEQADKEARVEFLGAFATFVQQLGPLAASGQFDFKVVKELLMFGVRGFPKSRTLETLISSMPDEPQGEPPEDTQVTVAKIKAEADRMLEEMRQANNDKERQHEMRMKGVDVMKDAAEIAATNNPPPKQETAAAS